jgi:hypothetical protein
MSRCAHGVSSAKVLRKAAPVLAPPLRPPLFLMRATSLLIWSSCSGKMGSGQRRSPVFLDAARSRSRSVSSLLKRPAAYSPSATTQAPVSVARSTMAAARQSRRA